MLLKTLSSLYRSVTDVRNLLYDKGAFKSHKSTLAVISIGNVQVGGSGKTPLVIFLASELIKRGLKPVVLSRGYGAKISRATLVTPESSASQVGDEPLLMARVSGLKVVVSPNRVEGAEFIAEQGLGELIILDDGLQHRRLKRDLEIIVVNAGDQNALSDFMDNKLLPYGSLREDRENALKRADLVVLSSRQPTWTVADEKALLDLMPEGLPLFKSTFESEGVYALSDRSALKAGEVMAFCGIANPQGFFATLEQSGFSIRERAAFPDHHNFTVSQISELRNKAAGLPLVCTEKDAVRISEGSTQGIFFLRGRAQVTPADAFIVQVMKML